jgi:YcaO-like protein with predicted kinase domain
MGVLMSRAQERKASAEQLNRLSPDELFERFAITRISDVTGMDFIGIPVYCACRPNAKRIAVSAGKSMDKSMARAGAIAEGIEFHLFENPFGPWGVAPFEPGPLDMPTRKDSTWNKEVPIAQDEVIHFDTGKRCFYPSDLVWITSRLKDEPQLFMGTTNGCATGGSFEDALVQGLCELVERDAVTVCQIAVDQGIDPPRVNPESFSGNLKTIYDLCEAAGSTIYLFYCTIDIALPVFWSVLIDREHGLGRFAGYGCHVNAHVAAERAMLEAVQSRAVYVSGARDDIMRRDFYSNQAADTKAEVAKLDALTPTFEMPEPALNNLATLEELELVLTALGEWKQRLFFKHFNVGDLWAVKAIIPGLEQPRGRDWWRPMRWGKLVQTYAR